MIKIVVPISGGKDSQACLKLALKQYDKNEVIGVFFDTKFEHPLTYLHIDFMREYYGVKIHRVCYGSVPEQVLKNKRFPNGGARFCTDRLKLRPSRDFYKKLSEDQGGFEVWLGMRSDESRQRRKRYEDMVDDELYPPHEVLKSYPKYLSKNGVFFKLPILNWTYAEVIHYLEGKENPLYKKGCKRVGCFPCLASIDKSKEFDFALDNFGIYQRKIVDDLEKKIGVSVWTSKSGAIRNNEAQQNVFSGCAICAI